MVVLTAVFRGPLLFAAIVIDLVVLARCWRMGVYPMDAGLRVKGFFWNHFFLWDEIDQFSHTAVPGEKGTDHVVRLFKTDGTAIKVASLTAIDNERNLHRILWELNGLVAEHQRPQGPTASP
jgi:hypothetical protein